MTDPSPPARRRWRIPEEIGVIAALVVMMVVIGIARPRFLNPVNLLTILGNTTFQGMLSLGMVFLLAIREIDLSVGWMFNFSAVIAALMMVAGFDPWLAALAGICFGALARAGERRDRRRASPAHHHRDPRHLLDVPGAVPGGQQRPRHRARRSVQQLTSR